VPPAPNYQLNPTPSAATTQYPYQVPYWLHFPPPVVPRERAYGLVAAWAAADVGSLPAVTEGFGGSLGLLYGPWRAEASFSGWWAQSKILNAAPNPAAGGKFGMIEVDTRLCHHAWAHKPWAVSPCAGVQVARLSGDGNQSLTQPLHATKWAVSAEAAVLGTLDLTDFMALRFDFDVLLPLNRPVFGIYEAGIWTPVFQPSPVAVRASAGVQLHFR
jgi:hypothetical protein